MTVSTPLIYDTYVFPTPPELSSQLASTLTLRYMPCAGEEPITSFFRRVTPGNKGKRSTDSVTKRKRLTCTIEAEAIPLKSTKQQRLVFHNAPQTTNSRTPDRKDSYASISSTSSTTPPPVGDIVRFLVGSTNPDRIAQRPKSSSVGEEGTNILSVSRTEDFVTSRRQATRSSQLPTPVTTSRRRRLPTRSSLQKFPTKNEKQKQGTALQHPTTAVSCTPNQHTDKASSFNDEAPVSVIRSPSQIPALQFLSKETARQRSVILGTSEASPRADSEDPFLVSHSLQDSVPSSQTQDNDILESFLASPPFRTPSLPARHGSEISRESWNSLSAEIPEPADDYQSILSSQTQHMLPYHISPRRDFRADSPRHRSLSFHSISDDFVDEVVESSQSQIERELDILEEISEYPPRTIDSVIATVTPVDDEDNDKRSPNYYKGSEIASHATFSYRLGNLSQTAPMARTLSDELFPSSILHLNFDGLYPPERSQNNFSDAEIRSDHSALDESATEDEFEEESQDVFKPIPDDKIPPTVVNRRSLLPSPSSSIRTVTANEEADYPSASQSSLPHTLQDFRDMFGEGDGGYPDGFPVSLR